ncbi:succinate dehydrogenase/fumarate reductase iron-sulfur subunit [Neolewinella lacunae]|uniref:Fumarate reductase iron-sulfur subunit n=1 Tax=Neolewinella lacunae TaxID=1517758 RepID=A0A923PL34_9BACT|nr:succinate dehydrogenase/fumarate reductase iron-sulfur subunit [Neolewinella lacunae]MBC6993661.1 succinate dehydrogenase/fumarate reductase iron-sulfur subunit [Neolewinella lacunae]MDN3636356.1 succinate dehydrogenase/fumarate reductase iron-sulfur subunit [Neolewinella lacunae]
MGSENMKLTLKIWRQNNTNAKGRFETYTLDTVNEHMSFLEMLDVLNEQIISSKGEPVAFEHDCREGICGTCSLMINGYPHGPQQGTTTCQLHMRHFKSGDTITIEPWRSAAFPVVKDLVVNRDAFDRIIQAGGYVSVNTGQAQDGNAIAVEKEIANTAMDAATCIGCGACVAACPNASAMLFTAAKVSHLALLPQGEVESPQRAQRMIEQHDAEGFGRCTNITACEAECPKEISVEHIARLNREYLAASIGAVR